MIIYVRENEDGSLTNLGPHLSEPRDADHEMSPTLAGRAIKLKDGVVVLDEVAEGKRLAKEEAEKTPEYVTKRLAEYPSIGDQLDAIYKMLHLTESEEYNEIANQIEAIKHKYPKPE